MTTYIIEPADSSDRKGIRKSLNDLVRSIRDSPVVLAEMAAQFYGREVKDYEASLERYSDECMSLSVTDNEDNFLVKQQLKGFGKSKELDGELRQTFCRMALAHCHHHGQEVNIRVV